MNKLKYYSDIFYKRSNIFTFRNISMDKVLNIIQLSVLFRVYMFLFMFYNFNLENNKYLCVNLIYNGKFILDIIRYLSNRKKSIYIFINFILEG